MSEVKLYTRRDLAKLATVGLAGCAAAGSASGVMRSMLGLRGGMMNGGGYMTLNGLFGGVPWEENNIEIVDNESTQVLLRCPILCKSILATKIQTLCVSAFNLESGWSNFDPLKTVEFPVCTSMGNRTFFYRRKLETVRMPMLNDVSDSKWWFYDCQSLSDVYFTGMQSSTALATKTSDGGFPWGAKKTCVFHFADGDFYGSGEPKNN